ncbi:MAG: hypothetical protein EHM35_05140 [Planctomycetaceae bacterium]|nr:MAG: hypothetical protein EHM35_05140 [Planctomycetaceae bacterium]
MYNVKWLQETAWAVGVAAVVFVLGDIAVRQDFSKPETWLPVLGAGVARLAAGVLLSRIKPV